jgi:hypothetical protein
MAKKEDDQIFSLYKSNKNDHTYRLSINKKDDDFQTVLKLKKLLEVNLKFSIEDTDTDCQIIICEIIRRKGDYLSFLSLYCYIWSKFNNIL